MNLDTIKLKKLMYHFNRVSERLMHTDFADFPINVKRFVDFIDNNEIIKEYVNEAGDPTIDIDLMMSEASHNSSILSIGNDEESEIANIYSILHYIVNHNVSYSSMIFYGYGHGSINYQDMIDDFNSRVTMVFISHIEAHLNGLGYDMGLDQRNINNIIYGNNNHLELQQGNNNTMINNIDASLDFDMVKQIIDEIKRNQDSFDSAFGENANEFKDRLNELENVVSAKDSSKAKQLLLSLKAIAEGAAGNLIASGVVALLTGVLQ